MSLVADMRGAYEALFDLESRHDLFNVAIEGVHFWKRCREEIFGRAVRSRVPWTQGARTPIGGMFLRRPALLARSLVDGALGCKPADVLVLASSRRFFDPSSKCWADIYTDPIVKHLPSVRVFQEPSGADTRRLRKPFPVEYLDYVSLYSQAAQRLAKLRRAKPIDVRYLKQLDAEFLQTFGVQCRVAEQVQRAVCKARAQTPLIRGILRRVKPRLALIVNSHGKEDFIEACHKDGVIVAELQHGMITPYHLGYSLPACANVKELFPDYLLLFGEFWKESTAYPLDKKQLLVTGYPFLDQERSRWVHHSRNKKCVVFLSQPTIGRSLSRLASESATLLGKEWSVHYRLHPSERGRWEDLFPWLVGSSVKVEQGRVSPHSLLANTQWHVGVNSTTVFEGIGLGSNAIIANLPGAEQMSWLIDGGYATLAPTAEEIVEVIRSNVVRRNADVGYLFALDAERRLLKAVQGLLLHHSC